MTPRDYLLSLAQANMDAECKAMAEAGYGAVLGQIRVAELPPDAVAAILDRLRFACEFFASNPLPGAALHAAGYHGLTTHFQEQFSAAMRMLAQE